MGTDVNPIKDGVELDKDGAELDKAGTEPKKHERWIKSSETTNRAIQIGEASPTEDEADSGP